MASVQSTPDQPQNPFGLNADRGDTMWIPRHQWTTEMSWEVPVGHGKAWGSGLSPALNLLLGDGGE
jgi:hypothetical protein